MKKIIVMMGSIGAAFLLILAFFPSIVSAQSIHIENSDKLIANEKTNNGDIRNLFLHYLLNQKMHLVDPGWIIDLIINFLIRLVIWWIDIH